MKSQPSIEELLEQREQLLDQINFLYSYAAQLKRRVKGLELVNKLNLMQIQALKAKQTGDMK